jgi:hypothetical protein
MYNKMKQRKYANFVFDNIILDICKLKLKYSFEHAFSNTRVLHVFYSLYG